MTQKQIIKYLKARSKELALVRDKLRLLQEEIEDESFRATEAFESLELCIDRLSETY